MDITPESTMKVTKDTVKISKLSWFRSKEFAIQLKEADPNELHLFIEKMQASIKGRTKSMKCNLKAYG